MLNKTKEKLDDMILDYPEYSHRLFKLRPLLEIATDLSRSKVVNFQLVHAMVSEVRGCMQALEILDEYENQNINNQINNANLDAKE